MSLGAQSFQPRLLAVLERRAQPETVRSAVYVLRDAGFDNISLDLVYGIPGQSSADLEADLAEALALEPEHVSCYELEAKPGTRFTHAHGAELERQAESMESYFERVVAALTAAGYRWYETANFCRVGGRPRSPGASQPRLLARTGLPRARDRRGLDNRGASAAERARGSARTSPRSRAGQAPPRELEPLDDGTRLRERVMLGLRLDEPLSLAGLEERARPAMRSHGSSDSASPRPRGRTATGRSRLTERGRFLGGGVTADLLA